MAYQFVSGDTGSILRVTCTNDSDGSAVNLTGCSVALQWRDRLTESLISKSMTINSPATAGVVQYQFAANELVDPEMAFEVKITDGSGAVVRSLSLIVCSVRPALA
jgi:hypothetical protein